MLQAPPASAYPEVGVIDSKGQSIIPCVYRNVQYLGRGYYFAEDFSSENPLKYSNSGKLFDHDGKLIPIKVPHECTLSRVILPIQSKEVETKSQQIPNGTLFEIHGKNGFGICDQNGNIKLEPKFGAIGIPREGYFPVSSGGQSGALQFIWNSITNAIRTVPPGTRLFDLNCEAPIPFASKTDLHSVWGYMDYDGEILIKPQFEYADAFYIDGLACVHFNRRKDPSFINKKGREVHAEYQHVANFGKECIVLVPKNGRRDMGLMDSSLKFLIEPIYAELRKISDNLYTARKELGGQLIALDSKGKVLFNFPKKTQSIAHVSDNLINCIIKTEAGDSRYVSINLHGDIVRKAKNADSTFLEHGFVLEQFPRYNNKKLTELRDKHDCVIQPREYCTYTAVSEDRLLKLVFNDRFNPAIWKNPNPQGFNWGMNRQDEFAKLLSDHDLIGMSKERVEQLLGVPNQNNPNRSLYYISYPGCFHSWCGFEMDFKQGKVIQWREAWNSGDEVQRNTPWFTTNMIVAERNSLEHGPRTKPPISLIQKNKH